MCNAPHRAPAQARVADKPRGDRRGGDHARHQARRRAAVSAVERGGWRPDPMNADAMHDDLSVRRRHVGTQRA
jgi:hypothetical protein